LERLVDDEISFVSSSAEKAEERLEAQRLDRMRTLFRTIDASVEVLYALQEQDQADQAATFFRSQIRRPLRQGFQALITAALEDERAEAEAQDRRTVALSVRLRAVVLAAAALGVVLVAVGGLMLHRTLVRPVGRLTAGAAAIERGEFGYRIDV